MTMKSASKNVSDGSATTVLPYKDAKTIIAITHKMKETASLANGKSFFATACSKYRIRLLFVFVISLPLCHEALLHPLEIAHVVAEHDDEYNSSKHGN
jgi:hypothetical protein